jgi:hypothetical protein
MSNDAGVRVLCPVCQDNWFVNDRRKYYMCADGWHVCSTACQQTHDAAARMVKELGGETAQELARALRRYNPHGFAGGLDQN